MIEKINHYSITSPASVYDEEALTALELAGRTAAKANECIDAFNKLETDTGNKLEAQNAFIEKMNSTTMPEKVKTEVNNHIANGDFDKAINLYLGNLDAQLNNLLGSVTVGSSTLDAEIIDGRNSPEGLTYRNIGENIRMNIHSINRIFNLFKPLKETVDYEMKTGYFLDTGEIVAAGDHQYCEISVSPHEFYEITNNYGMMLPSACVKNASGELILLGKMNSSIGVQTNVIQIPSGGAKLYVNKVNGVGNFNIWKIAGFYAKPDNAFYNNLADNFGKNKFTTKIEPNRIIYNAVFQNETYLPTDSQENAFNMYQYDVKSGDVIRIKSRGKFNCHYYAMVNIQGYFEYFSETYPANELANIDIMVTIPPNVNSIWVSDYYNTAEVFKITETTSDGEWLGKKWCVVGDSLTEVNGRTSKNYHHYITEKTGISVVNLGQSGTGYKRTDGNGTAFYQRISSVPADSDVVTIFGSGNDMGAGVELGKASDTGTSTLCGCINTTIDNLIAIMPTVKLGIITPTPWVGYNPANDNSMKNYANAIVEICKRRSIPCLDLYHCSNLRPWTEEGRNACYTKDDGNGVHPDETGHKIIASQFYNFLNSLIGGI